MRKRFILATKLAGRRNITISGGGGANINCNFSSPLIYSYENFRYESSATFPRNGIIGKRGATNFEFGCGGGKGLKEASFLIRGPPGKTVSNEQEKGVS